MALTVFICLMISFIATTLGASMVFFPKKEINEKFKKNTFRFRIMSYDVCCIRRINTRSK